MRHDAAQVRELLEPLDPQRESDSTVDLMLLDQILASARQPTRPRKSFSPRLFVPAGGMVAAAIIISVVLINNYSGPERRQDSLKVRDSRGQTFELRTAVRDRDVQQRTADPASVLIAAADGAQRRASPDGGRVRYRKTVSAALQTTAAREPFSVAATEVVESWVAPDGSGTIRYSPGPATWPSAEDKRRAIAARAPARSGAASVRRFGRGKLTETSHVGGDPKRLLNALRSRAPARGATGWLLNSVAELLAAPDITPRRQAVLLRTLARLQGLKRSRPVTDQLGRPGVGVAADSDYAGQRTRYELIVDPTTGAILQYQELLLERVPWVQAAPPIQLAFELYIESSRVGHVGAYPARRTQQQAPDPDRAS